MYLADHIVESLPLSTRRGATVDSASSLLPTPKAGNLSLSILISVA